MPTKIERIASLKREFPSTNKSKKQGEKTIVSRSLAMHIAQQSAKLSPVKFARFLRTKILPGIPVESAWYKQLRLLAADCADIGSVVVDNCPHKIFVLSGNSKLPFATWSTLPAITCPGAGACLKYCYSFKAWRYPRPFCRQVYLTMLLRDRKDVIRHAWQQLPEYIDVRLYVDGDIDNVATLLFWQQLCKTRPDLRVYGYSKSWQVFLDYESQGGEFANNYLLNLSSGSKYGATILDRIKGLRRVDGSPVVRGLFAAVRIDTSDIPKGSERYKLPLYHERVRQAIQRDYGSKGFSCPGDCGACGATAHMCGNDKAQGLVIGIGVH